MNQANTDEMALEVRRSNPYSTRWVRPGAVPFIFPSGADAAGLFEKVRAADWRGAIVGPHGSGKSTLLATLVTAVERMGISVRVITLHDGERNLPAGEWNAIRRGYGAKSGGELPAAVVVVDGYEQLGWWAQRRLGAVCRRRRFGLLVTTHGEPGLGKFPVLFRTEADLATVQRLVDEVLPAHGGLIRRDDVAAAFNAHGGNVRETLFALYDLFERRRRASSYVAAGGQLES